MTFIKSLVVDDDFVSRSKMSAILTPFGECRETDSGQGALIAFQQGHNAGRPLDLIALDIEMPGMDGTQVLARIREEEKRRNIAPEGRVKIIMVSSHSGRDKVVRSIQAGCDNYLLKPFTPADVADKLALLELLPAQKAAASGEAEAYASVETDAGGSQKRFSLAEALKDTMKQLRQGKITLPAKPDIYIKFKAMKDDGCEAEQFAELLKQEIALTGRLIKIANSASFRGLKTCKSLLDALVRLGLEETERQIFALAVRPIYIGEPSRYAELAAKLWQDSLSIAYICEQMAKQLKIDCQLDPFTLGLMRDIGKIVLLDLLEALESKGKFEQAPEEADLVATIEQHHGLFGAALLKSWNFPQGYQELAFFQAKALRGSLVEREYHLAAIAEKLLKTPEPELAQQVQTLCQTPFARLHGIKSDDLNAMMADMEQKLSALLAAYQ